MENVYVCGWYEDKYNENARAFVLKTDSNGQEIWRDTLDVPSKYFALCITHTGNLILAGSLNNLCFLNTLNSQTGTEIWEYEDSTSNDYWFATVNEIIDSNVYKLFLRRTKYDPHKLCYYLIDPVGGSILDKHIDINTVYGITYTSSLMTPEKVWTGGNYNFNTGLVRYNNFGLGSYLGCYWTFSAIHIAGVHNYSTNRGCTVQYYDWGGGNYYMQVLTMKFDVSGIWGNSFEITRDNFSVTGSDKYENGKFVITGTINNELALWFIDHDLTEMEDKTIPTQNPRTGIDVVALPSSDMILMGSEQTDADSSSTDIFLMKLDQNGLVSTGENKLGQSLNIYPNPASDKIFIKNGNHSLQVATAQILNSMGRTVKTIYNLNRPVSVSDLPSGLYVVVIYSNNKLLYREKFIKR
ncbi:MAG: hypothetical protein DRJ09_12545 [Bacteroidetes bacterium]|nr:MAG: hypothetical protein DRJ09_12545 [Bacteroidota bacterium]